MSIRTRSTPWEPKPEALVAFLEALYTWECSEEEWLQRVGHASQALVRSSVYAAAFKYDASGPSLELLSVAASPALLEFWQRIAPFVTPEMVARSYRALLVGYSRQLLDPVALPTFDDLARANGVVDALGINGADPSGCSAIVHVGVADTRAMPPAAMAILRRMANHLASAARARRRISAGAQPGDPLVGADAVCTAERGGQIVHAEGAVKSREQRETLKEALVAREAIRGRKRRTQAGVHEEWRPLVDARWTLVDTYEPDGKRFIVARENQAEVHALGALSERERQVVAALAFGQSTKEIAYVLGIDDSTTRVLIGRAARKLKVAGRSGLLAHPAVKALRGGFDP